MLPLSLFSGAAAEPVLRVTRMAPSLSAYRPKPHPFAPTQQATDGSLAIYLDGRAKGDVLQMLFGLAVLRSASGAQVESAIATVQTRSANLPEIRALISLDADGERPLFL